MPTSCDEDDVSPTASSQAEGTKPVNHSTSLQSAGSKVDSLQGSPLSPGRSYLDSVLMEEFAGMTHAGSAESNEDWADDEAEGTKNAAETKSMSSSQSTSTGGSESSQPPTRFRAFCSRCVENKYVSGFFMSLTFYALFAPDVDMIYGNKETQKNLQITTTAVVVLFLIEIVLQVFGKKNYASGAYLWLDIVSLISLLPETYFFQQAFEQQNLAAGRSTRLTKIIRVASRSSKAARLNRLSRIVRVAALMPRIQRFFGSSVQDSSAERRLLDKKLTRLYQFLDEDMDGLVSRRAVMECLGKLRCMVGTGGGTWASKVTAASGMASRVADNSLKSISEKVANAVISKNGSSNGNGEKKITAEDSGAKGGGADSGRRHSDSASPSARTRGNLGNLMDVQMNFAQFRAFVLEDDLVHYGLRRACKRQLKEGNKIQNISFRNSEYIGVKVALCVLLLLLVFTFVESVAEDSSAEMGLKSIDGVVRRQFPGAEVGSSVSPMLVGQINIWTRQDQTSREWGDKRDLLYLDLNKTSYCNEAIASSQVCDPESDTGIVWGPRRKSLVDLDDMVKKLDMRWQDLEWLRYPDPFDLDEELTTEMLEDMISSIALLDRRPANQDEGVKSVLTTMVVIVIILSGITMLTRDLTFLSKNLLKPLVELADEMESITRLQIAAVSAPSDATVEQGTSEVRMIRKTFENMKKAIKSWGKYVPWPVVQLLLRTDAEASIDVNEREVSIYFSDIAGFTTIVESLPPEQSLLLLSRYFHDMSKIIDEYGGIVLEFIGDAIMSIYGAPVRNPDHATAAVNSAVRMLASLKVTNAWFAERNLPQVAIRCGVHTGTVLVGNMGFASRMKYGVVGEESNIPGHLEELNKSYSTEMLISSATYQSLQPGSFLTRPIDKIVHSEASGGIAEMVYQVIEWSPRETGAAAKQSACDVHEEAMELYGQCDFAAAATKFEQAGVLMKEATGVDDFPCNMMVGRCMSYMETPPPASWDGVWDRAEKH